MSLNILQKQKEFMDLYELAHSRLARFVHSMVWQNEEAKDIISETVLIAFEKFETLNNKNAFQYFLFGIASNLVKRKERRKKFRGIFNEEIAEKMIDISANVDNYSDVSDLYKAMNQLPLNQREAVSLFEISGFSLKEIQDMQGGSLSGVKSRIARGREELSRILGGKIHSIKKEENNSVTEKKFENEKRKS